jgi:hypothetical protein
MATFVLEVSPDGQDVKAVVTLSWGGSTDVLAGKWQTDSNATLKIGANAFQGDWARNYTSQETEPGTFVSTDYVVLAERYQVPGTNNVGFNTVCQLWGMTPYKLGSGDAGSASIMNSLPGMNSPSASWRCVQAR